MIARINTLGAHAAIRPFDDDCASGLDELFSASAPRTWGTDLGRLVAVTPDDHIIGHVSWGTPHAPVTHALAETKHSLASADSEILEIQQLLVAESHRRCGVGVTLLTASVNAVHAAGCVPVLACGMDNGAALGLYFSEGFAVGGRFMLARDGGFYVMVLGDD